MEGWDDGMDYGDGDWNGGEEIDDGGGIEDRRVVWGCMG